MGDKMKHLQLSTGMEFYRNFNPVLIIFVTLVLTVIYMSRKKLLKVLGAFSRDINKQAAGEYKSHYNTGEKKLRSQTMKVYFKRSLVFTLFGLLPLFIVRYWLRQPLKNFGYGFRNIKATIMLTIVLYTISFPVLLLASKSLKLQKVYPEIRESIKSRLSFLYSTVSYVLFYFGYEALYRGFLLFGLKGYLGEWGAIIISMGFVSVSHINAPGSVFLASVISGFVFPWINFKIGSIWPVFLAHSGIGISMDYLCLKRLQMVEKSRSEEVRRNSQY